MADCTSSIYLLFDQFLWVFFLKFIVTLLDEVIIVYALTIIIIIIIIRKVTSMEIKILMKSKGETTPRAVFVKNDKAGLTFFCKCPKGGQGYFCEHKIALVSGDETMLFDEHQDEKFRQVLKWVNQSELIRT